MLVFIDCEADGPCPSLGRCTEFAAIVLTEGHLMFHATHITADNEQAAWLKFGDWLSTMRLKWVLSAVSDNPAFDWQWINDGLWRYYGSNPMGHSCRRIGDFYAGLKGNWRDTQGWKRWRVTPHDHNALHDVQGNIEAYNRMMQEVKADGKAQGGAST